MSATSMQAKIAILDEIKPHFTAYNFSRVGKSRNLRKFGGLLYVVLASAIG
jgi:hypothetical protein